jgi:hypothetical protein
VIPARTVVIVAAQRQEVNLTVDRAVRSAVSEYVRVSDEAQTLLGRLLRREAELLRAGQTLSLEQLRQQERARQTLIAVQDRLASLASTGQVAARNAITGELVPMAVDYENALIRSQLPPDLQAFGTRVSPEALQAVVDRADQRLVYLRNVSTDTARTINRTLTDGIVVGDNPRDAARTLLRRVGRAFDGGIVRAERIMRTEMLDAYRNANAVIQNANRDVVEGWEWWSAGDERTCFPAGTLIRTVDGDQPIETLAEGDRVLTHAGKWRRVYGTLSRTYSGATVTIRAGAMRVTATAEHPFLVERDGTLQWVAASDVRVGDDVLTDRILHGSSHVGSVLTVERGSNEPDNTVSGSEDAAVFGSVTLGNSGPRVPVRFVNLDGKRKVGEPEIDRPAPSDDVGFLFVPVSESVEAESDVAFGDGFACRCPVAAHGAITPAAVGRDATERLSAGFAVKGDGGTSARFGAMSASTTVPELLSAGAGCYDGPAGASAAGVAVLDRCCDGEGDVAFDAGLVNGLLGWDASAGAVFGGLGSAVGESVAASGAGRFDSRAGDRSTAGMGVGALVHAVAGAPAELAVSLADPSGRHVEGCAALLASPLHRLPVSQVDTHYRVLTVYNIEVEGDHSYVANGFAVHNCAACWAMHGEQFPNDVPGPDGHPNCRCARIPVVLRSLAGDFPAGPSKDDLWERLTDQQRLRVLGPTRYELTAGGPPPRDFAVQRESAEWRTYRVATPVRELVP